MVSSFALRFQHTLSVLASSPAVKRWATLFVLLFTLIYVWRKRAQARQQQMPVAAQAAPGLAAAAAGAPFGGLGRWPSSSSRDRSARAQTPREKYLSAGPSSVPLLQSRRVIAITTNGILFDEALRELPEPLRSENAALLLQLAACNQIVLITKLPDAAAAAALAPDNASSTAGGDPKASAAASQSQMPSAADEELQTRVLETLRGYGLLEVGLKEHVNDSPLLDSVRLCRCVACLFPHGLLSVCVFSVCCSAARRKRKLPCFDKSKPSAPLTVDDRAHRRMRIDFSRPPRPGAHSDVHAVRA
jgi:hypothetical protein